MRSIAVLCASAVLTVPVQAQTARSFGDWFVACDNTRTCTAVGMGPEADFRFASISISRAGETNAQPRIAIHLNSEIKGKSAPLAFAFDIGGLTGGLPGRVDAPANDSGATFVVTAASEFIAALRKAKTLTVRRADAPKDADDAVNPVSLSGSVAALRWMDDQQKRAGTVSALVATGDKPASPAAPPPAPVLQPSAFVPKPLKAAPQAALQALWKKECEHDWDFAQGAKDDIEAFQIGADVRLWILPCSSGNRHRISLAVVQRGSTLSVPDFERLDAGKLAGGGGQLANVKFAPATRSLNFDHIEPSGCGSSGSYLWTDSGFKTLTLSAMEPCRGAPDSAWPTIWRATARPQP